MYCIDINNQRRYFVFNLNTTTDITTTKKKATDSSSIGAVLQSMMRSGLKDDNLDLGQIWRMMFTINNNNANAGSVSGGGGGAGGELVCEVFLHALEYFLLLLS